MADLMQSLKLVNLLQRLLDVGKNDTKKLLHWKLKLKINPIL